MNLLCASGLKGAEELHVESCLATLDRFASAIRRETEKYLPMYARNPEKFRNIEGFYRMQMLVTVLKQDLGIKYSEERSSDEDAAAFFGNSKDIFIHGLLSPPYSGTCASMPVLVVAIGRRLGYPLKLVAARKHLFARWESDDGKERFNVECTNGGMISHPDEYYLQGPFSWEDKDFSREGFLESMFSTQNLVSFLDLRGMNFFADGRYAEAKEIYELAATLSPRSLVLKSKSRYAVKQFEP